ncbi:putative leucine-rich repeat-containing protein DDB_G0290503 isoform X1 [Papilio machaon]|uniref:putative leucine-rich repeat-containing protein DDB_G0290503 isoform X1 n=1 Tax=Papilio machaon TaxID=76193 RepID=UPI001E662E94|nr:putative leucine-rich repeat-containing protein DDB_G0290503 isoform X1 [Papilio machaon]
MSSVERVPQVNNDSEMEEGEIVDEWDDLSDISSEEEFLLRQRLLVLENYNNVLERKEAKRVSLGKIGKSTNTLLPDLSEISATELEDNTTDYLKHSKNYICSKASYRRKKINLHSGHKKNKKRYHRKRKLEPKIISESSEDSDDEYRNKRRKLANAVALNKAKVDTSLKARLEEMLFGKKSKENCLNIENLNVNKKLIKEQDNSRIDNIKENTSPNNSEEKEILLCNQLNNIEIINETSGDSQKLKQDKNGIQLNKEGKDECDGKTHSLYSGESEKVTMENNHTDNMESSGKEISSNKQDSDDDVELLRQHALKTKSTKTKSQSDTSKHAQNKPHSEDDESDTADLRLICLKSALLKKAIEMKMKQKMRKRLKSKSKSLQNDIVTHEEGIVNVTDIENNTDIESVDMDIGSDGDDKAKESNVDGNLNSGQITNDVNKQSNTNKPDELEDDEDLLRAQLLTSLTKNLPNLVAMDDVNSLESTEKESTTITKSKSNKNVPEEKKFIINLKDTDSEGEHEATKNLTKMHMKLSERLDFQEKLDLFLKSTRLQVENNILPDVVQQPPVSKPQAKYVPKAVNHLPKSEQIEYKNLVKRMAELEKMKQIRQASMNQKNDNILKETVNPRNITVEAQKTFTDNLEQKIAISRKNIAEESAKMLKLKEEATKLLQKYKIVATELRNISTAITMNRKEQRTVQSKLARIRINHQMLLKSSNFKHSTERIPPTNQITNKVVANKFQKENKPTKEENKSTTQNITKTVNIANNLKKENTGPIPKQVDNSANNQTDRIPKILDKEKKVLVEDNLDANKKKNVQSHTSCDKKDNVIHPVLGINCENISIENPRETLNDDKEKSKDTNEYQSPLNALGSNIWQEDPNAFLCPYEVGGSCRDPDCKFLHPKIPSKQ